jgi:hypothetical protein
VEASRGRDRSAGVRPWFLWLTDAVPVSPLWVGVAISAALLGLFFAIPMPSAPSLSVLQGRQILISFIVLTGAQVAAMPWLERAALGDLAALRHTMKRSEEELRELEHSITHFPARGLWLAILIGLAVHILISTSALGFSPDVQLATRALFPTLFWMVNGPATYVLLSRALLFGRLGRDLRDIHLFDLRPLKHFSQVGLRTALFYSSSFAVLLAAHRDWSSEAIGIPTYAIWAMLVGLTPVTLLLSLLPVWGVHRRIAAEKAAELDRIRAAVDGVPDALGSSPMAAHAAELRGIALLEYREKVEAIREWPFDASLLRRLALYLLIPPLGWLGGALVERVVDRTLQ